MYVIIPAKASSERVPFKNWRTFCPGTGKSLVELAVDNLVSVGFSPYDIYISCENWACDEVQDVIERMNAQGQQARIMERHPALAGNDASLVSWMQSIHESAVVTRGEIAIDEDVMWFQVCDPFVRLSDLETMIHMWEVDNLRQEHDSMVLCYTKREYLMFDTGYGKFKPFGWAFGRHHTKSQNLPLIATMPFTCSILKARSIRKVGYHVGENPYWYCTDGSAHIDIDTLSQFELAGKLFGGVY